VMLQRMSDRVDRFVAAGANVILLQEPPEVHQDGGLGPVAVGPVNATDVAYEHMNSLLAEVAARNPSHVAVVNLGARVCPSGPPCPYVVDGFGSTPATFRQAIRPDLLHYQTASSLWVARWLVPRLAAAAKKLS
jgi:hypothetical protein